MNLIDNVAVVAQSLWAAPFIKLIVFLVVGTILTDIYARRFTSYDRP